MASVTISAKRAHIQKIWTLRAMKNAWKSLTLKAVSYRRCYSFLFPGSFVSYPTHHVWTFAIRSYLGMWSLEKSALNLPDDSSAKIKDILQCDQWCTQKSWRSGGESHWKYRNWYWFSPVDKIPFLPYIPNFLLHFLPCAMTVHKEKNSGQNTVGYHIPM